MKERIRKYSSKLRSAVLVALLATAGSSLAFSHLGDSKPEVKNIKADVVVNDAPLKRDGKLTTSFAPVVKRVAPSVVNVFTTTKIKAQSRSSPFRDDPFFRRFFGDDNGDMPERGRQPRKQSGLGSGVVVSKDGYILTNNHVVDNADEIKVGLTDGREFQAKVVGKDSKTDVAVLKIDAKDLPYIELADSDKVEVGDLVLAVGNPFGVGQTVTMGMVSAKGRNVGAGLDYEDFIQTDAAINPGNSGGALVDAEGRLVGINTLILTRTGGNQGIGFAVPVNLAKNVMDQLIDTGHVTRGFLGVKIQDVTPALAKEFDLDEAHGAIVTEITPKSPAEKAGIKTGDVITKFDGKTVEDSRHLKLEVGQTAPDKKVPLTVLRDGKTKNFEVSLKELQQDDLASNSNKHSSSASDDALDGVYVADLDSGTRRQLDLPGEIKGAFVNKIDQNSAAYEAGLREGDVIQEINRQPVDGAERAVELCKGMKNKKMLLRVWSNGGSHFLVVDESKVG